MSYTIDIQDDPPLVRVAMRGFWTREIFDGYARDCGAAMQKLAARHGRVDMLSDCNEFPIQGPEVSAGFEHLKQMTSPIEKIRIAIVTPSALGRMQAERLLCGPRTRVFASEASALEWLGLA